MKLLAKILPVIVVLALIAVGCKKPKGAKKIEGDAGYHTELIFSVPFCGPDSNWWEFLPYGEIIDSKSEFDLYFGCADTSHNGQVGPYEPDFLDFDSYDLMLFEIKKNNVLSYDIRKIKMYVNDDEKIFYIYFKVTEKNAGHGEQDYYYYVFVEIPKGYEDYEVNIIGD